MNRLFLPVLFFLLTIGYTAGILSSVPPAQEQNARQDRLILERADRLSKVTEQGKVSTHIVGNVKFRRGDYVLYCDEGIHHQQDSIAIFWGHVRIFGNEDSLFADSLTIYDKKDILVARGNARLRSGAQRLNARRIRYFTESEIAQAIGNVRMREESGRTALADSVWYNSETKQAELYGADQHPASVYDPERQITIRGPLIKQDLNTEQLEALLRPVLTKQDSADNQLLQIISNTISGNPDSGRYVAAEDVVITRDSLRAETQLATLYEGQDHAILEESPVVYYSENTIRGETIHLYFRKDTLREVYIPRQADVHSGVKGYVKVPFSQRSDSVSVTRVVRDTTATDTSTYLLEETTRENVLRGTQLRIWLEKNRIRTIRVTEMATSTYHVFEDSVYQGINETSGDTINLHFAQEGDSLEQIDVIGGTRGNFQPHEYNTSVDTTIFYEANELIFLVPERITHLRYEADAKYKDMELEAAFIDVFWNDNLLVASPLPDSVNAAGYPRNTPTFHQAGKEPMTGQQLEYNMKTRRGRVLHGETKDQEGFYAGDKILQRGENTLYVETGRYTTCDLDDPHFYFRSRRMKLMIGDLVVARPIVMYIHNVPIFALPFGVFPQQEAGRSSGYILPTWGESSVSGRYLRGLGYYWAPSEYWDYRIQFDFWERRGISLRNRIRYNKRYTYNGDIAVNYDNEILRDNPKQNYEINISHNQTIDPTMDLRVNGQFVSSSQFLRETSIERRDRLKQQIVSNATLSKRWEDTKNSMVVNLQRTENLQSGNVNQQIPQISFRRGTDKLLKPPQGASFAQQNKWYYNINYSFGSNLRNQHTHKLITDTIYTNPYGVRMDLGRDSVFVDEFQRGISHTLSFNSPNKILRYLNISPSLSFNEDWVPSYREPAVENGTVQLDTVSTNPLRTQPRFRVINQYRARHTFRFSVGATTKLYGLFNLPIAKVPSVRHVLTPSISYNIGPDFSEEWYGYYYYARMPDGSIQKFDRFQGTAAGPTGARETQSVSISLRNVFQAKYLTGSGEDQKENKIDFLTWNINTGYNVVATERPWRDISSSIRASLGRTLSLDISMRHDPYKWQSNELTIPRLTNLTFATGFSISGNAFVTGSRQPPQRAVPQAMDTTAADTGFGGPDAFSGDAFEDEASLFPSEPPLPSRTGQQFWNLRMNFRYSLSRQDPTRPAEPTFWMNTSADFKISKNWSVSMSNRFDLAKQQVVNTDFTIRRDLHCWELSFRWTPSGPGQGYYLKLNVKSPNLQDIKVESRGGRRNRFGYY
ncbi:MAG TPA: putative LPS assembly protein LptD [bacterium]|nr:putative LPS assembly protein LptD [bacterium]